MSRCTPFSTGKFIVDNASVYRKRGIHAPLETFMMFARWITRARASREWVKSLDLCSKQKFQEALARIEVAERLAEKSSTPTISAFQVHVRLLKAFVLLKTGNLPEALGLIRNLEPIIARGRSVEGDYLRAYLACLVAPSTLKCLPRTQIAR